MMDAFSATERVGPYTTWSDGSPVYLHDGTYQRSPEQVAAGQTYSQMVSPLPWTPLEQINAALQGERSGDRPAKPDHPDIALEAAEATQVLPQHLTRSMILTSHGVQFSDDPGPVLEHVNALLSPTELTPDDTRGVVVATHPRDGVIGACVVTATYLAEQLAVFIDRVAVAPAWRRRGLGSVLLRTAQGVVPGRVDFMAGHCSPSVAPFFAQAGCTVLQPGVGLLLPVHKDPADNVKIEIPGCWFYRQGRA